MATFWAIAGHSVCRMFFFVFILIVNLVISHFGFEGGTLVLIASVPGHCSFFTFCLQFIMEDSIEEGLLEVQKRKLELMREAFRKPTRKEKKLQTIQNVRTAFGL